MAKFPRFAFEKFPGADETLGTQMKSVGEAMGIGRTFTEALLKAMRSRELDSDAATPWRTLDDLPHGVHPWFAEQVRDARRTLADVDALGALDADGWLELKRLGWSDAAIGERCGVNEATARSLRHAAGVRPAFRRVDSCAAEVEAHSNYLYSTWGETGEVDAGTRPCVVILGSGPNRIGQGIEFDYCCVQAAWTFGGLGFETVMVNCNPETVSTDYDTSDRLYFEPLGTEEVLEICERERPVGAVIQFGGQTPLKLASSLQQAGIPILGTPFDAVDLAEDRERFAALCDDAGVSVPPWGIAEGAAETVVVAESVGYPVLVRPSYVLGGRNMRVCYDAEAVAAATPPRGRVLVDRFLEGAFEIDVDALSDGTDTYVAAVMQHVEEAGVHSGDSSCVLPPTSLSSSELEDVRAVVRALARALGVVGLVNVQLALCGDALSVIEANPRASRTVPFASKAIGVNLVEAACKLAAGASLDSLGLPPEDDLLSQVSVKAAVFPFQRFPGADPVLGPEMRSTGEVMASAPDFATGVRQGRASRGPAASRKRHRVPLGEGRRQARGVRARPQARAGRLPAAGDVEDGLRARCRRHSRRGGAQGHRGRVRAHGRRSRAPRTL